MKTGTWVLDDLYEGAYIRSKYPLYYHHGIYIGNDQVIEFGNPNNTGEQVVEITTLKQFGGNSDFIEVYKYSKKELKQKYSNQDIVKRAKECLGEGGYDFIKNNCEHFATRIIFGKAVSKQVDAVYEEVEEMLNKKKGK